MAQHRQVETLPEIAAPTATSELQRSRSFVVVTRPEFWNATTEDYQDITQRMIDRADPVNFRNDLLGARRRIGSFAVDYELDNGSRTSVTLNADEYRAIQRPFDPGFLANTVDSATRAGKYSMLQGDALGEKSSQKQATALVKKYEAMQKRKDGITPEHTTLAKLEEASRFGHYWLSRGHTSTLRAEVASVLGSAVPNMIGVVGHQRQWTEEQADFAKRSLEYRLFFTFPHKERMGEWHNLISLLKEYDETKITAFQERMGRVQGFLRKVAPDLELPNAS